MYNTSKVVTELKKVVGWRDFWDLSEIPTLGSPLNDSESGQYFQEFSGALRLDYIQSLLASNRTLTTYLDTVEEEAIKQVLNQIETYKQLKNVGKDIATNDVVYDMGRKQQNITNESRFCGVMFQLNQTVGLAAILNRVGLYLTAPVTNLNLYLFHSTQEQVISTYQFTTAKSNSFSWQELQIKLEYDIDTSGISGGAWYLGYYQDDLAAQSSQAVRYTAMNWSNGYCSTCDGGAKQKKYNSIASRLSMMGFYVPNGSLPVDKNERFDTDLVVKTNSNNWGFNFNISIVCDTTQFWIDNRITLVKVLGLTVAMKVLEMMKYSSQINNVEEAVKVMIVRDLEGASDTGLIPLWKKQENAIKALVMDEGNLNVDCLPCARKPKTTYGAIGR
jgi:hypothetical protein